MFFIDQITKKIAIDFLEVHHSIDVIGKIVRFTLTYNPYGLFGIPFTKYIPYEVVAILAIFLLFFFIVKEINLCYTILYGFLLGGAMGNLYDRIKFGAVIDFIDIGITDRLRWPIFNLADTALTIGILAILFLSFVKKK